MTFIFLHIDFSFLHIIFTNFSYKFNFSQVAFYKKKKKKEWEHCFGDHGRRSWSEPINSNSTSRASSQENWFVSFHPFINPSFVLFSMIIIIKSVERTNKDSRASTSHFFYIYHCSLGLSQFWSWVANLIFYLLPFFFFFYKVFFMIHAVIRESEHYIRMKVTNIRKFRCIYTTNFVSLFSFFSIILLPVLKSII